LLLELCNVLSDRDEHIAEFFEFSLVADGPAVSGNDDCVACRRREIGVGYAAIIPSMLPPVE
jgi:hypothetical protein